ncbi:hypothetical protein EQO05_02040 [Methanosarcina sp. MSH10X1]|nr:hypothetical protein EQO05_02040 [Methanosarcina sp. MSH10X1]
MFPFSSAYQDSILPINVASLKEGAIQGAMEGFVDLSDRPDSASARGNPGSIPSQKVRYTTRDI